MSEGIIKRNLDIFKTMDLGVDLIFIPEIHPDGLVLNYSTTYEFRSELEDILMNPNSSFTQLPSRVRTYLKKEYGTVDINDTNYGKHFKEWPLDMIEVVKKLPEREKEEAAKQIKEAIMMVLGFLMIDNNMSINTFLYPNLDNEAAIKYEGFWAKVKSVENKSFIIIGLNGAQKEVNDAEFSKKVRGHTYEGIVEFALKNGTRGDIKEQFAFDSIEEVDEIIRETTLFVLDSQYYQYSNKYQPNLTTGKKQVLKKLNQLFKR